MKNVKWKIKSLLLFFFLLFMQSVFAYEDCIITAEGRMSDIKIQHNDIIDVFPLITVMNDKNTIIVHPLKTGQTKFSVVKDNNKFLFDVKVTEEKTYVNNVDGFEILTIDCPPSEEYFELDEPPTEFEIDEPPSIQDVKI